MNNLKEKLAALHNKTYNDDLKTYFKRLKYNNKSFYIQNKSNLPKISEFIDLINSKKLEDIYEENIDILGGQKSEDILLATVDRYGLPIKTILNMQSGLVRTDPYYKNDFLSSFYSDFYRAIYTWNYDHAGFFHEQHTRGVYFYNFVYRTLGTIPNNILDYGCGMGGVLLPFFLKNSKCLGLDYGQEYIEFGKKCGIDLRAITSNTNLLDYTNNIKYDLVILSHVLEHIKSPLEFLNELKQILPNEGYLLIQVPLIESIPVDYDNDILRYLQNAHAWSFSRYTIEAILSKTGFRVIQYDGKNTFLAKKIDSHLNKESLTHSYKEVIRALECCEAEYARKHSFLNRIKKKIRRNLKSQYFAI